MGIDFSRRWNNVLGINNFNSRPVDEFQDAGCLKEAWQGSPKLMPRSFPHHTGWFPKLCFVEAPSFEMAAQIPNRWSGFIRSAANSHEEKAWWNEITFHHVWCDWDLAGLGWWCSLPGWGSCCCRVESSFVNPHQVGFAGCVFCCEELNQSWILSIQYGVYF